MASDGSLVNGRRGDAHRPMALTRRERRRRWWLLSLLLLLLALLAYTTYYFVQNRRLPLTDIKPAEVIQPPQYLYSITGSGKNQLYTPTGVGVAADGRVYVVDFGRRRVAIFTSDGTFIKAFSDGMSSPVHLWVKGDEVWVSDRRQGSLEVYNLAGEHLRTFEPPSGMSSWGPLALAFDEEGNLRVTDVGDSTKHRLLYFSTDGSMTATVGHSFKAETLEDEPGGFSYPNGVAIAPDGRVFVSDGDNRRVQVFSSTGVFEAFVDTSGIPRGIAIDKKRQLYVADAVAHTIDVFDLSGKRITQFGGHGIGPGQFNYPNDIALDGSGRIYISDRENNQVQVWGWPVAQVPAALVTPPKSPWGWLALVSPLFLLPLIPLLRKRRVVVTPDFVTGLVSSGEISTVAKKRRLKLIAPESDRPVYLGLVAEGVSLERLIDFQAHSESDARALKERFGFSDRDAVLLSMAERAVALATVDPDQRGAAKAADIRTLGVEEFIEVFVRRSR